MSEDPPTAHAGSGWVARAASRLAGTVLALLCAPAAFGCEVAHKVIFAGLDWDSNAFHTAVAQRIVRDGFGCQVDLVPGSTIPLHNGMARGDIHVMMEVWKSNTPASWTEGVAAGKLVVITNPASRPISRRKLRKRFIRSLT